MELYFSERSLYVLDGCAMELEQLGMPAINTAILLDKLARMPASYLDDYLHEEENLNPSVNVSYFTSIIKEAFSQYYALSQQEQPENENQEEALTKEESTENQEDAEERAAAHFCLNAKYDIDVDLIVSLKDNQGKIHKYPVTHEVRKILGNLLSLCVEHNNEWVEPIHILGAMFASESTVLKDLFDNLSCDYISAKEYFACDEMFDEGIIPIELEGFVRCLNDEVDKTKACGILGREKEMNLIWNISLKKTKRNTVIVGEPGVGKTALMEMMAYQIVKGTCPKRFRKYFLLQLDVNALIAGTSLRGQAEERTKQLIDFLEERNDIILFIDEVHTILGAGAGRVGEMDLANALKPILSRGDTIVIGATTNKEYENCFVKDAALSRRFERVEVRAPKSNEVYAMIKNKIKELSAFHKVKITKNMVEYAIMIAHCFAFQKNNPDKTLDLIDRSMVSAVMQGKDTVDKECILANYNIFFNLFEGMGEAARKEIAYHEAGHYIVGKMSKLLQEYRMLAVSIMPAEDYVGVTCKEPRDDRLPHANREYYIEQIALNLAGRVAEKMLNHDETSGAGEDIEKATCLAFDIVTHTGISVGDEPRNNTFLNTKEYPMFTEKIANSINEEVKKLIAMGYQRAEHILTEHRLLLKIIVKQLLKKHIMSEKELDQICQQYLKNREA